MGAAREDIGYWQALEHRCLISSTMTSGTEIIKGIFSTLGNRQNKAAVADANNAHSPHRGTIRMSMNGMLIRPAP
ncbi:MAG: hypothetical protein ACYYK0_07695 [Candidatus Eutrophobiaceae bacterium]